MADRFLSVEDRQTLAGVIGRAYDLQLGPAARLQFLTKAGLSRFAPTIDLAAPPNVLAGVLIDRLEPFGLLPERPTYHALGSLIGAVMADPGTPRDQLVTLATMLVKYELVTDRDYLAELRAAYGLDVAPARTADPDSVPPPRDPDPAAEPAFDVEPADAAALEIIVNTEDNFLDIDLLAGAIYTAQAVGRVEMPQGRALGTGFLVGPDLLLTNQHVLKSKSNLASAVVRFDYHADPDGVVISKGRVFEFVRDDLYESSISTELDYALVRIKGEPLAERQLLPGEEDLSYLELLRRGRHRGYLLLAPHLIVEGERLNIIQHPNGDPQKVVLTQNYVIADMAEDRVHYLADTMPGSSGSPILNRHWEVVALHHAGGPHPPQKMSASLEKALKGHYKFNEGIPMRAIIPQIERYLPRG
jgi:hypothetical protein